MDISARHLAFHGAIVLLIGLLLGIPYGRSIGRNAEPHIVHSWRIAHASLPMGAVLMLAVSAILSSLAVTSQIKWVLTISLIVSVYTFCLSMPLAAVTGHRGLSARGPIGAKLVFIGYMIGAFASLIAASILVYATFASL
jgi:hypothetical protein